MTISITDTWAAVDPPFGVELYYSSAWHDVSSDVGQAGLSCSRGRKKPGQHVPASTFGCQLANPTGEYSPRNPNSSLYGLIGRNTPVRGWVEAGTPFLDHTSDGYAASTPDSAGLSVTGDIEIQWYGWRPSWRHLGYPLTKWTAGSNQSYYATLEADGTISLAWSTTGSDTVTETSTAAVPFVRGEGGWKATLDVDNGASGYDVTFYFSQDGGSTWAQLGDVVTGSGTTSIYDGTASVATGYYAGEKCYWLKILEGIAGTERANPVFEDQASGTSSFADAAGNTWTVADHLWNRHYRYWGEVNSWPQEWGKRGSTTAYSPIGAAGVMQRFEQGATPLKSCYYRAVTSPTAPMPSVVAYWPMEVEEGATVYPSGLPDMPPAHAAYSVSDSNDSTSFPCSDPLPVAGSDWAAAGPITGYTDTGEIQVFQFVKFPSGGVSSKTRLFGIHCGGTAARWMVSVDSSGNLYLNAYDSDGTTLVNDGPTAFAVNGKALRVGLHLATSGSDVDWTYSTLEFGESVGTYTSGTLSSQSIGRATWWATGQDTGLDGCTVGQVTVQSEVTGVFDQYADFNAHAGEETVTRIERLAGEESIDIETLAEGSSVALGYQGRDTVLELLRDAEDSDLGILYEPRTSSDLAYRSGISLCGQPAQLALDYTGNLLNPFKPVEDTTNNRNKVTVTRRDTKASATAEDATSALGTQPPPAGIGLYEESVTLSLGDDAQARQQASWRLHEGTVDEARWPTIGIDLAHPTFKADGDLTRSVLLLDIGDRVTVNDLPSWLPPFTVDQIVQGYDETITPNNFTLKLACSPYSPNRVGVWDQDRYTTDGTVLNGALDSTATTIPITNDHLVEWGHADGDYDIIIDGEEITVGGVTGTGTSQSFTSCTRSVNGVVRSHADGAAVDLADPYYLGL